MDYFYKYTDLSLLRHLPIYSDQIAWCICLRMSGPWPTVLMDFLKQLGREMQNGDPKGRVASLALGVEPLGAMDSLRAATYAQDQDQQLNVAYMAYLPMGLSFVSAVALVVRLLRPVACMGILLLQH